MDKITCCICSKDSIYHMFHKVDTYQLMRNLEVKHYTGVSYCKECWDKLREHMHKMMDNPREEESYEASA